MLSRTVRTNSLLSVELSPARTKRTFSLSSHTALCPATADGTCNEMLSGSTLEQATERRRTVGASVENEVGLVAPPDQHGGGLAHCTLHTTTQSLSFHPTRLVAVRTGICGRTLLTRSLSHTECNHCHSAKLDPTYLARRLIHKEPCRLPKTSG